MSGLDLVIFGATGDLSARKLFPALCQLDAAGLLPDDLRIVAVARQEHTPEAFHDELRVRMAKAKRQSISDSAVSLVFRHSSASPIFFVRGPSAIR